MKGRKTSWELIVNTLGVNCCQNELDCNLYGAARNKTVQLAVDLTTLTHRMNRLSVYHPRIVRHVSTRNVLLLRYDMLYMLWGSRLFACFIFTVTPSLANWFLCEYLLLKLSKFLTYVFKNDQSASNRNM